MLKISVIIPSFNQGKYLERTILSVLSQDYPGLEIFVMDGGSTDESAEIIKKYENRLTAWVSEKDKGQSDAINKGFKMCNGDIIAWLCSDDLYTPGALHKVNEIFSSLPESVGVIHGDSELFRNQTVVRYDKGWPDLNLERLLSGMGFPQPSSFMRRSAILKSGFVNEQFHYGMDYDLFSRMIMVCDFRYVDFLFSRYRLHEDSKSTTAASKFIQEWSIIFNSILAGLEMTKSLSVLERLHLRTTPDEGIRRFFSANKNNRKPDEDKMLFYFLVNAVTYDYATNNFQRVRKTGEFLKNNFKDYLILEPKTYKVIKRSLLFPPFFLRMARNLKRTLLQE